MNPDVLAVFDRHPGAVPLYAVAEAAILRLFPAVTVKASKTQVGFFNRYGFAYLSPPARRIKGWPYPCVVLTFGLGHRAEHPRIAAAVEPYPGRWTHHVPIGAPEELDEQVEAWLREAYAFSLAKGRRK